MKKNKNALKGISLFSGAMGLDLGFEKAGIDILAAVEFDKYCAKTIRSNRPKIRLYEQDINTLSPNDIVQDLGIDTVDIVFGGPPCQAFSTAGKRESFNDFRGNVIVRFLDYVRELKPKYFVLENVRGIYYAKLANTPPEYQEYKDIENVKGSVVYFLFKEFSKLGYTVSFTLLDSSLYGVPQSRERFIMMGVLGKESLKIPEPTTEKNKLTLQDAIGELQNGSIEHEFVELRDKHKKYLKMLKGGQYWKHLPEEVQEEAMGKAYHLGGGKTGFFRRLSWDKPAPTLVTHPTMPATMLIHPEELRPLSVQEYSSIQQFPRDWDFNGNITATYKQIGNAVPVGLAYVVANTVVKHSKGEGNEKDYTGKTSRYKNTYHKDFLTDFTKKTTKADYQEKLL